MKLTHWQYLQSNKPSMPCDSLHNIGYWDDGADKPFEIVGIIDYGFSAIEATCNGWNGEPMSFQTHYCDSVDSAKQWLIGHGCTRIIDKVTE